MRLMISTLLVLFSAAANRVCGGTVNLGPSTQGLLATGLGPDSSGNGQLRVTLGSCVFDGTTTACTLSGSFTGLGPGGTYAIVTTYPGNGPSPVIWTQISPGSSTVDANPNGAILTFTFNVSDGTKVSFLQPPYLVNFVMGRTCSGVTPCSVGEVGLQVGSTISGPVTGTVTTTPTIRTNLGVINAGAFGASSATAPGSWIEIFGRNLTVGLGSRLWAGTDFVGANAPTALGGTSVTIGGKAAFVEYISAGQVNAQAPSDVGTGPQPVIVSTIAGGASVVRLK